MEVTALCHREYAEANLPGWVSRVRGSPVPGEAHPGRKASGRPVRISVRAARMLRKEISRRRGADLPAKHPSGKLPGYACECSGVAQLVERQIVNLMVAGSSPATGAKYGQCELLLRGRAAAARQPHKLGGRGFESRPRNQNPRKAATRYGSGRRSRRRVRGAGHERESGTLVASRTRRGMEHLGSSPGSCPGGRPFESASRNQM